MTDLQPEVAFKTKSDLGSWDKVYWYLRMLVNQDRFGGLSRNTSKLKELAEYLLITYKQVTTAQHFEEEKVQILWSVVVQKVEEFAGNRISRKVGQIEAFLDEIKQYLTQPKDFFVFGSVISEILLPTNRAIDEVPTIQALEYARIYARAVLETKKERGLSNLLREWDVLTEELCLNRERDILVDLFRRVKENFSSSLAESDLDILLTALCQEYERRVGQKRKQRAGNDLESATSFILDYFGIKGALSPEHFTANIEVDNWVKDKKGWYIGISLKRTLRERWKQTDVSKDTLTQFKIKNVIHLINYDQDLSDSKIGQLGSNRHIFFLADESPVLQQYRKHTVLGEYLFPMSRFIEKLRELMN